MPPSHAAPARRPRPSVRCGGDDRPGAAWHPQAGLRRRVTDAERPGDTGTPGTPEAVSRSAAWASRWSHSAEGHAAASERG